jgi:hypothetical protein
MTTAPPVRRPLPGCPAICGQGIDLDAARFTLIAQDCQRGPDRQMPRTEVSGFWQVPGQDSGDLIRADGFTVPFCSPVAFIARKVARSRRRTRIAGELLRAAISACPCPRTTCPACDHIAMLRAISHAASQPLPIPRRKGNRISESS